MPSETGSKRPDSRVDQRARSHHPGHRANRSSRPMACAARTSKTSPPVPGSAAAPSTGAFPPKTTCSKRWCDVRPNTSSARWTRPQPAAIRSRPWSRRSPSVCVSSRTRRCTPASCKASPSCSACFPGRKSSRSGQFADGIAHTLRRCGADIPEPDLANIADILLRVALGIIVFPTDRLDTSDPAAVRDYAARYLVPIIAN